MNCDYLDYYNKYIKYKNKYLQIKNQIGKGINNDIDTIITSLDHMQEQGIFFSVDNINYICWCNKKFKTLSIQHKDKYNAYSQDDKISIKVNNENIEVIVGDYHVVKPIDNIPSNWQPIVDITIKIVKIIILSNKLKYETDYETVIKILNIPNELFNASNITIEYYNKLMNYFSTLNINESININDIDINIYKNFQYYNSLHFWKSRLAYIDYIKNASIIHHAYLTSHTFNGQKYDTFEVSTNGAMAVVTKSILNIPKTNFYDLVLDILTLFLTNDSDSDSNNIIASYLNGYTSFIRNYPNIQFANTNNFITKDKNQNFLQWFIMSMNPLSFFVPANSVDQIEITEQNILDNMKKCLIFYSILNLFIKNKKEYTLNYMQSLLFTPYSDNINFNKIIKQIQKEQKSCKFSKFYDNDGFSSSTTEDMLTIKFLNELYCHKYLDPRHLITILTGSQIDENYRLNFRNKIPELLSNLEKLKTTDLNTYIIYVLQYFSRLKLARFEAIKLGNCIDKIQLDGMYLLTPTELNNNLSDDDIKMATYFFNKYENSKQTIRCNTNYLYLEYDNITYNENKFSVIIKILKSNEMHFILYLHNTSELKIDSKILYDFICKNIDINKTIKTKQTKI